MMVVYGKITDSDNDYEWYLKHTDTLPGFGYIEAGKTNKQFCVSPFSMFFNCFVNNVQLLCIGI